MFNSAMQQAPCMEIQAEKASFVLGKPELGFSSSTALYQLSKKSNPVFGISFKDGLVAMQGTTSEEVSEISGADTSLAGDDDMRFARGGATGGGGAGQDGLGTSGEYTFTLGIWRAGGLPRACFELSWATGLAGTAGTAGAFATCGGFGGATLGLGGSGEGPWGGVGALRLPFRSAGVGGLGDPREATELMDS